MRVKPILFILVSLSGFFFLASLKCNRSEERMDEEKLKEHLINANRIMVKDEMSEIADFILRHQLKMDSTGTGLRYAMLGKGTGKRAVQNDSVSLSGKIFLLDATLCYEYASEKPLIFSIGHKGAPRGIEEAALLMHEGDKGKFIIPAHLGYGMLGDRDKIPGNSALYAELELMRIIPSNKN
jgi:FKBP-type peptidyl-prolyl cis-trans isomerase